MIALYGFFNDGQGEHQGETHFEPTSFFYEEREVYGVTSVCLYPALNKSLDYTQPFGDLSLEIINNMRVQNLVIIFAVFMFVESYMIGNSGQRHVSKFSNGMCEKG